MTSNKSFIDERNESEPTNFYCDLCGSEGLIPSRIIVECNYGSINDGERLMLEICGNCADRIYSSIVETYKEGNNVQQ